ncbi:MAG: hypothetical protein WDZ84_09975 [Rhodovibrionaceae bacterium]
MKSKNMKIEILEAKVIMEFLSEIGVGLIYNESSYYNIPVCDRRYSNVGFLTEFKKVKELNISNLMTKFTGGSVEARLNKNIETGYLIYVNEGHIASVEGYTYGDDLWPDKIHSIEVFH